MDGYAIHTFGMVNYLLKNGAQMFYIEPNKYKSNHMTQSHNWNNNLCNHDRGEQCERLPNILNVLWSKLSEKYRNYVTVWVKYQLLKGMN